MLSYIEVHTENLKKNISSIKSVLPDSKKIIAVVKANAYGVGMREVVPAIQDDVDAYAVDDVQELHAIRFLTEKDVYVLGYVDHASINQAVDLKGILVAYDTETIQRINTAAQVYDDPVGINIKIDAHLGRQGVNPENLTVLLDTLRECKHVYLRGLYAHFANIEDTTDQSHAQRQIEAFNEAIEIAHESGYSDIETHISSTAGSLVYDARNETNYSHVRIGLGLYGLWPSEHVKSMYSEIELLPVVRWISHIAQVKELSKGSTIGYGLTYRLKRDSVVAVIPQGYSDGYDRHISNNGYVLVHGQECPVLGRVAMNMFVVDVTDVESVQREDEVVLLGSQGDGSVTAEDIADVLETINYEVVARISPLLPRIVVDSSIEIQ